MSCTWSPGTLSAMLAPRAMVTIAIAVVLNSWCNPQTHLAPAAPGDERVCGVAHDDHHDPGRQRARMARLATRGSLTGRSSGAQCEMWARSGQPTKERSQPAMREATPRATERLACRRSDAGTRCPT